MGRMKSRMIHLDSVTKVFDTIEGPVRALDGVTLGVQAGEFVALQGPSGCGKSTLLSVVGGLALPTSGGVRVADCQVSAMSSAARARFRTEHLGFVFQMFHLLPYLSVLDNVLVAAPAGTRPGPATQRCSCSNAAAWRPADPCTGTTERGAAAAGCRSPGPVEPAAAVAGRRADG